MGLIYITLYYELLIYIRRSDMARVNKVSHSFTCNSRLGHSLPFVTLN